ncbi:uncharacterized protein [Diadema antillarum]|uniref:uncharacterized protein n=1 Tax=Diadema antillarum TaxID=105358 RepID=UPI003A8889C6
MKRLRSLPLEPKGHNFSFYEKLLLLDLISEHGKELIEENDTLSFFRRTRIWRVIHTEYNRQQGVSERSEKQLRLLWKNLKARSKREFRLNAAKYRVPGSQIQDPLLRKMNMMIGMDVSDDSPKPRQMVPRPGYGHLTVAKALTAARAASSTARAAPSASRAIPSACSSRGLPTTNLAPRAVVRLEKARTSQLQIARTYSMAPSTQVNSGDSTSQMHNTMRPQTSSAMSTHNFTQKSVELNSPAPILIPDEQLIPGQHESKISVATVPNPQTHYGAAQEMCSTVDAERAGAAAAAATKRRKKTVPRKAHSAVKPEAISSVTNDDVIAVQGSSGISDDFLIKSEVVAEEENDNEWQELVEVDQQTDPNDESLSGATEPYQQASTVGPVLQNNLHNHILVGQRRRRLTSRKTTAEQNDFATSFQPNPHEDPGRVSPEEIGDVAMSEVDTFTDQPPVVLLDAPEGTQGNGNGACDCRLHGCVEYHSQMIEMAKKEHDTKMASILMKRKQIMQIKRREHLAKMENFRLNKEILRLKKRKLELEIKNGMYLDEMDDALEEDNFH